jgi:cytosine deaminase
VGDKADFVLVGAETVAEAVVLRPPCAVVGKRARIVARDGALLGACADAAIG